MREQIEKVITETPSLAEVIWPEFTSEMRHEAMAELDRGVEMRLRPQDDGYVFFFGAARTRNPLRTSLIFGRDEELAVRGEAPIGMECECLGFLASKRCRHLWGALIAFDRVLILRALGAARIRLSYEEIEEIDEWTDLRAQELSQRQSKGEKRPVQSWINDWRRSSSANIAPSTEEYLIGYLIEPADHGLDVYPFVRKNSARARTWKLASEQRNVFVHQLPPLDQRLFGLRTDIPCELHEAELEMYEPTWSLPHQVIPIVGPLLAASPYARFSPDETKTFREESRGRMAAMFELKFDRHRLLQLIERFEGALPFRYDDKKVLRFEAELKPTTEQSYTLTPIWRESEQSLNAANSSAQNPTDHQWIDNRLVSVEPGASRAFAASLTKAGPIEVEAQSVGELLDGIVELGLESSLRSEELETLAPAPRRIVRVSLPKAHTAATLDLELHFDYEGEIVRSDRVRRVVKSAAGWRRRNEAAETEAFEALRAAGVEVQDSKLVLPRPLMTAAISSLSAADWKIEAAGKPLVSGRSGAIRARSSTDWFDLEGYVEFGDQKVALPDVLRSLQSGERFLTLGDGSLGVLPEDWLSSWAKWLELGTREGDALRFARTQSWVLDALLAAHTTQIDVDKELERTRSKVATFQSVKPLAPPKSFQGELRSYQREGLGWLAFLGEIGFGGCLADDMGLGKTVQVLAHVLARRRSARKRPALIVVPRSLIFNWQREAARFAPKLRVLDFSSPQRWKALGVEEEASEEQLATAFSHYDLVLTTYGTLRRDVVRLHSVRFDVVALDEAQAIKNAASQSAKAARLLSGEQRLALSGTPVENHLDELWSIFEFLNPGMLGRNAKFEALLAGTRTDGSGASAELKHVLRPFLLRRTKDQVLKELPPKTEQVIEVELEGKQKRYYEELRQTIRASLLDRLDSEGLAKSRLHVLQALLRLRQAACHAGMASASHKQCTSAKLEALVPRLQELAESGHKALVFSQFTTFLGLLKPMLDQQGICYEYLDGRTKKREERVQRFQEDAKCSAFLISLKAGGHGLNLTAADYVFLLDPWWNPAVEAQAIDRAHRMGQASKVFAYRLIARGTIEEKVLELQQKKRELAASIFEDESASLRDLTREDLEQLLG